ncbi:hypothetical protein PMEGAPL125_10260 [Priestia megaterium]|uniref:Uncharacterized protein n=1 Tax=Priestia megaterium TaxID=1404 RepID=A0AAX6BKF4_PRIMG|nr:hypothetical protein ShirakiTB12_27440 [Priestia megaterium]
MLVAAFMLGGSLNKQQRRERMKLNDAVFGELEFNTYDWI